MKANDGCSFGSILVAADGSSGSKSAAYIAARVASIMHWRIHALYVIDASQRFDLYANHSYEWGHFRAGASNRTRIQWFRKWGTHALAEIEDLCRIMNVPATVEMILGDVTSTILKLAARHCLLALGRRGNHHPPELDYLGGNFRRIVQHADSALLVGGSLQSEMVRALLACDQDPSSQKALAWAERLQTMFMDVTVLSIGQSQSAEMSRMEELRSHIEASKLMHARFIPANGEPGRLISSVAAARGADMIFMGTRATSRLSPKAIGGNFDTVLRNVNVPILAARGNS